MPGDLPREPDPYEVLELRADASSRDITRAYRRLARAWHPDTRPGEAGAAARFQAVSDAYELLSDPARRATYDQRWRAAEGASPQPAAPGAGAVPDVAARGPAMPPLWPLGPTTASPIRPAWRGAPPGTGGASPPGAASRGAPPGTAGASPPGAPSRGAPGGPAVRPGPVRIEPLPGTPAADQARAEALLLLIRSFLSGRQEWPW